MILFYVLPFRSRSQQQQFFFEEFKLEYFWKHWPPDVVIFQLLFEMVQRHSSVSDYYHSIIRHYKHTNWICRNTMNIKSNSISRAHSTQCRLPVKRKKLPLHTAHRLRPEKQTSTICLNIRTTTFEPKTEYNNQLEENYWKKDVIWKKSGHRFFQQPTNLIKNCSKNNRKWSKRIMSTPNLKKPFKPHAFDLIDFGKLKILPQ